MPSGFSKRSSAAAFSGAHRAARSFHRLAPRCVPTSRRSTAALKMPDQRRRRFVPPTQLPPTATMENTMRTILYGTAAAIVIIGLFLEDRWPNVATASFATAPSTIDVGAVGAAIDMNSLPRLQLAHEVYE